jgi:hypothetical protein
MRMLIEMRWVLLTAALGAGVGYALALFLPGASASSEMVIIAAAALQAAGAFVMGRHFAARGGSGGWASVVAWLAVVSWVVAYVSAMAGTAAGAGGLVYGLLITLPALALAPVLQGVAAVGFALKERTLRAQSAAELKEG